MIVTKTGRDAAPAAHRATTPEGLTFTVTPYLGANVSNPDGHPNLGVLYPVAVRIDQDPGYFVMRNGWDPIAQYVPAKRASLKSSGRRPRNVVGPTLDVTNDVATGIVCTEALHPESDGLAAWRYRIPPGHTMTGPNPALGGGQWWLVLRGSDESASTPLTPMSLLFHSPEESAHVAVAGPEGLDVLTLQFPLHEQSS